MSPSEICKYKKSRMRLKELPNPRVRLALRCPPVIRDCPKGRAMEREERRSCYGQIILSWWRAAIFCCSAIASKFCPMRQEGGRQAREQGGSLSSYLRNISRHIGIVLPRTINLI